MKMLVVLVLIALGECHGLTTVCYPQDISEAIKNENLEQVKAALSAGARLDANGDPQGYTPLMGAAMSCRNPEIIAVLIKAGAKVDDRTIWGEGYITPLFFAAYENTNPAIIEVLVKNGAKVNDWDEDGMTPLMIAATYNPNPEVIMSLLSAGAKPSWKSAQGKTAYEYAEKNEELRGTDAHRALNSCARKHDMIALAKNGSPEQIRTALAEGGEIDYQGPRGYTLLMYAAAFNPNPGVIETLIGAGAKVDDVNLYSLSALIAAAASTSNPEVVSALLRGGSKCNERFGDSGTPLMYAAYKNPNPEILTVLLNAGATVDARGAGDGFTPLMLAASNNPNPDIIIVLLRAGADAKMKSRAGKTALDYAENNKNLKGTNAYLELKKATF